MSATARRERLTRRVLAALGPEPRRVRELAAETGLPTVTVSGLLEAAERNTTGPDGPLCTPDGWVWVS